MSNSEMVQPTQEHAWRVVEPHDKWKGLTGLTVAGSHEIVCQGTGREIQAAILRKKEGRDG